jgi:GTP-binding protein
MKKNLVYERSAYRADQWPEPPRPEVVILGRSNSGKSSFINSLAGRKVAKVSQTPGKTRSLNFFLVNDTYRMVDVPGYGWSERSGQEMREWRRVIETYLRDRQELIGALLIMDARRAWSEDEQMLQDWLRRRDLPLIVVLNKADKLGAADRQRIGRMMGTRTRTKVVLTSALDGDGIEEVEKMVYFSWVQPLVKPQKDA